MRKPNLWILLLLVVSGMSPVGADDLGDALSLHGCRHLVVGTTDHGTEITQPCVEFLALREGMCREMWVQGDTITEITTISCPVEELKQYLK